MSASIETHKFIPNKRKKEAKENVKIYRCTILDY